jgi:peroxiredoxin Q/BCP
MKTLLFSTLLLVITASVFAQELNVGDAAPEFKTIADDGSTWDLKDHLGKEFVVVYFYPAAMTGGCTKQACAYRDFKTEIADVNAVVVGVSGDSVEGLKLFKKANDLNFPLLSDESGEIAKKFGVPVREGGSISREVDGQSFELTRGVTASRWTFVINRQGKIAYKNTQVDVTKDTQEILDFIKNNG